MLLTTQGLVLHTTPYADSSIIAKVFTRVMGMRSYIIKGVRSQSGRTKQNLLQPLSLLDMTVYNNPKKQLQFIKEMHPAGATPYATNDGVRMALMFFMDEVLYKSLKDEEPNERLFDYVVDTLHSLSLENDLRHLPISFMLHTSRFIGIEPMNNYSLHERLFNLKEGRFLASADSAGDNVDYCLDASSSNCLHSYLNSFYNNIPQPQLTASQRSATLNNLIEYYHIHLADFKNFKSHEVLHAVLR